MVEGIEADPVAAWLATVRIALQEPATVAPTPPIKVLYGDMFANVAAVKSANVVLMNPPFKRYESQDARPIPAPLREYYKNQIKLEGGDAITASGQPNLFNFYVEWIGTIMVEGATMAVILDNKWYHSRYGSKLKGFLLSSFEIKGIVEYPHDSFFKNWMIATSILVATKRVPSPNHEVKFIRSKVDPRGVDLQDLSNAFHKEGPWPFDWTCRRVKQSDLKADEGWKSRFSADLVNDYRLPSWPTLPEMFATSRRGSLQKEGGGVKVFEFPFTIAVYGPKRLAKPNRGPFQTRMGARLSLYENQTLSNLASKIPSNYRGYALQRADDISGYVLNKKDVTVAETIEPPYLRRTLVMRHFKNNSRATWTKDLETALQQLKSQPDVNAYISEVEKTIGLTNTVLSEEELWVALREPYAGELIVPRKTREGHRVHVNCFAIEGSSRQLRLSSNFISFSGCIATDISTELNLDTSVRLIAAFLVSSFGQLQFEIEGYNREGLLSLEKHHLKKIRVLDPRRITSANRLAILSAFEQLPYPISANTLSVGQHNRNALDDLFSDEIVKQHPNLDKSALLNEVHQALDEWTTTRSA